MLTVNINNVNYDQIWDSPAVSNYMLIHTTALKYQRQNCSIFKVAFQFLFIDVLAFLLQALGII